MILSGHAIERMLKKGITETEVKECIEHGCMEIELPVRGEMRYGKKLDLKNRSIVVIYTLSGNEPRVITVYQIVNRKWQE